LCEEQAIANTPDGPAGDPEFFQDELLEDRHFGIGGFAQL
jgi:hypothetical protein